MIVRVLRSRPEQVNQPEQHVSGVRGLVPAAAEEVGAQGGVVAAVPGVG